MNISPALKDTLESISYIVAILAGFAGAISYLIKQYRERSAALDAAFIGQWTNEGNIDPEYNPTHYVDLELVLDHDELSGILSSRNLNTDEQWNGLSVRGRRKRRKAMMEAVHIRNGQILIVAKFTLRINKRELLWTLTEGRAETFSRRTKLWPE